MISIDTYFIISPLLGAAIGCFTNWLAIKMLFRPHTEKRIFGIKLPFTPGLIPKRRDILAKKVGATISEYLLTDETLIKSMCSDEVKKNIELIFDNFINEVRKSDETLAGILSQAADQGGAEGISRNAAEIAEWLADATESEFWEQNIKPLIIGLIEQNVKGVASLFVVPESVYRKLRESVAGYLKDPENHETIGEKAAVFYDKITESVKIKDISAKINQRHIDSCKRLLMSKYDAAIISNFPAFFAALGLSGVIEGKINDFEMEEAEKIIISVVDRELKAITYLGGVLGFIIGLAPPVLQSLGI